MDQSVHWYVGRRWLEGLTPYATGMDTKPPGVFAIHALSVLVFGDHQYAVRVVDLAFVLLAGALIATFRARTRDGARVVDVVPRRPGELGAACLATSVLTYTFFDWSALGHSDLWQGVLVLAAGGVVVRAPDREVTWRRAFAAGAVAMAAVTLKHVAGVAFAFGLVVVALPLVRRRFREAATLAGAYAGGALLVLALTILPFAVTGALGPLREAMVDLIVRYVHVSAEHSATPDSWPTWRHGLVPLLLGPAMALGGLAIARFDRDRAARFEGALVLLAIACGIACVLVQMRARLSSFSYHWLAAIPALALGVAWGLRQMTPRHGVPQLVAVIALGAIAFSAAPAWLPRPWHDYRTEWENRAAVWSGTLDPARAEEAYHGHQTMLDSHRWQARVADWIRARARPGDTLCVDGYFGAIHQETGLDCPGRLFIPPHALDGSPPAHFAEWERMFERDPPTFFVTVSNRAETLVRRRAQGYVAHDIMAGMRTRLVILERRPASP
ncbi:MAG: hypothetical protein R3B82_15475 [Sandaracinaceae bacterium]